jgi:hypothetical protein
MTIEISGVSEMAIAQSPRRFPVVNVDNDLKKKPASADGL